MNREKEKCVIASLAAFCFCTVLLWGADRFSPVEGGILYNIFHFVLYIAAFAFPCLSLRNISYYAPKKPNILHFIVTPVTVTAVVLLLSYLFGMPEAKENQNLPLIQMLKIALLSPVLEELLFRKGLCKALSGLGFAAACIVSSILFAAIHPDFVSIVYSFAAGLILSYVYLSTGSIAPCIFAHIVNNVTFLALPYFLEA